MSPDVGTSPSAIGCVRMGKSVAVIGVGITDEVDCVCIAISVTVLGRGRLIWGLIITPVCHMSPA